MIEYKYQIHEVHVMSFRTNDSQQISMFDSFNVLTERLQEVGEGGAGYAVKDEERAQ